MKAIVKTARSVAVKEVPLPKPKKGEVRIRIIIAAICRTDSYAAQGKIKTDTPLVLGHEFSGVVDALGSGVKSVRVGDRIAVMPIRRNALGEYQDDMLGLHRDGAFAEYICVPETMVFRIPEALSFQRAAYTEPMAASLAILTIPLEKKESGLILGDNRIAQLTHRVMQVGGFQHISQLSLTDTKKKKDDTFDFAIETNLGAEYLEELVRVVKPGGLIIIKSRSFAPIVFPMKEILRKELVMVGAYYGDFQEAIDLLCTKKIQLDDIFGETVGLKEAVEILLRDTQSSDQKKTFIDPTK